MDPVAWCEDRVAGPGSTLHYSLLWTQGETRAALLGLHALDAELGAISETGDEPALASQRLGWWESELGRFLAGGPRHPLTRLLQAGRGRLAGAEGLLAELLDGHARLLGARTFADADALHLAAERTAGVVHAAAARACGAGDEDEAPRRLGAAIGLARQIRRPYRGASVRLPADLLAAHGLSPAAPPGAADASALRAALRDHLREVRALLAERAQAMSGRTEYGPGLIEARIELAVLDAIERDGCRVLERRISVTPLRKLWIAWRGRNR